MIAFVRHGETEANRSGLLLGRADPPLTEHGVEQARRAAEAIGALRPVRLVTSPLSRARETAAIIGEACGLEATVDDRLVELDYGSWDGTSLSAADAERVERWRRDSSLAPHGGESLDEVGLRVAAFCLEVAELPPDAFPLVAVSHVSPIKAAVAWALGSGQGIAWRTRLDLASVTRIRPDPDAPVLLSFNETAHLR